MSHEMKVDNPEPGGKGFFALVLESLEFLQPEDQFEAVKAAIEFRRRCMNQGFDNLLELIEMTRKNLPLKRPNDDIAKGE